MIKLAPYKGCEGRQKQEQTETKADINQSRQGYFFSIPQNKFHKSQGIYAKSRLQGMLH
jgi:hypothetical protein